MLAQFVLLLFCLTTAFCVYVYATTGDIFHPLIIFPVLFFYFALGPVVSYLLGGWVYPGVVQEKIADAVVVFALVLVGMFAAFFPWLRKRKIFWDISLPTHRRQQAFWAANGIGLFLNFVTLSFVAINLSIVWGGQKGALIARYPIYLLWHYNFLLFWNFFLAFMLALNYWERNQLFFANVSGYVLYCLLTNERDFLLVLLAVLAFRNNKKKLPLSVLLLVTIAMIGLFLLLFSLRFSEDSSRSLLDLYLGQGGNLHIITNLMVWRDSWLELYYGSTYIQSIFNLVPSFVYREGIPLTEWFVQEFAPDSKSGYGFTLEGEAYLNFGILGVPFFFYLYGKMLMLIYASKLRGSLLGNYMYYFCFIFVVYTLRGDSLMLFKGLSYALGFFFFMLFLSNWGHLRFRRTFSRT